jgi:hypothetical protein
MLSLRSIPFQLRNVHSGSFDTWAISGAVLAHTY